MQQRNEKKVKGNEILQASLEKRKQDLYKQHLELEQDVSRLQKELQIEKGLMIALKVQYEK
ncbi:MAG: hypothetical protein Q8778_02470 [Sweet potato little leaf phytoplasma]|nr:hypothetical protein [Sweet potato little leaf phytoplasma]